MPILKKLEHIGEFGENSEDGENSPVFGKSQIKWLRVPFESGDFDEKILCLKMAVDIAKGYFQSGDCV